MYKYFLLIALILCSFSVSAQWQQTGSKVRYVTGIGIPTKDTAAGVLADSSQILIRPADSSLYVKYKRTWLRVGGGAGGGSIGGSGTTNYIPKFTSSTIIGNSQIFDNGSFVGIGTTSPSNNFHVVGTGRFVATGGISSPVINLMQSNDVDGYYISIDNALDGRLELRNQAGTTLQTWQRSSGNVGIGYSAPAAKLSVSGTTLINTNTDNGVDKLQVNGSMNVSTLATTNNLSVTTNATVGGNITASGTLTAATIVKSGGTSSQALMADGSVLTVTSGSYTASLTNASGGGTSSLVLNSSTYQRIGNIVTVYFDVSGNCTASSNNQFNMTIPIGNAFNASYQAYGNAFSGLGNMSATVSNSLTTAQVFVNFQVPVSITTFRMFGSFQYKVQ